MSSKSKDQNQLNKQLIEFGFSAPSFLSKSKKSKKVHAVPPDNVSGKGALVMLNHYIVTQVRALRMLKWSVEVCNVPVRATEMLRILCCERFGLMEDLTQFSQRQIRIYHAAKLRTGEVIYATDSYHMKARHDFVWLENGKLVRCVALVELNLFGAVNIMALVEATLVEDVDELRVLECPVITEGDNWFWVTLSEIERTATALPHAFDKAWHLLIRNKHDETVWE